MAWTIRSTSPHYALISYMYKRSHVSVAGHGQGYQLCCVFLNTIERQRNAKWVCLRLEATNTVNSGIRRLTFRLHCRSLGLSFHHPSDPIHVHVGIFPFSPRVPFPRRASLRLLAGAADDSRVTVLLWVLWCDKLMIGANLKYGRTGHVVSSRLAWPSRQQ